MTFPWFGLKFVSFWQPVLDPGQKPWRDEHVLAHVLGGMLWAAVFHLPVFSHWHQSPVLRLAAVVLVQLTLWEAIQRENWRPELMGLPPGANHGYPWLSGIWDVLFTLLGAAIIEGGLFLVHCLIG